VVDWCCVDVDAVLDVSLARQLAVHLDVVRGQLDGGGGTGPRGDRGGKVERRGGVGTEPRPRGRQRGLRVDCQLAVHVIVGPVQLDGGGGTGPGGGTGRRGGGEVPATAVEGDDDRTGGTSTPMNVERHVAFPPPGERIPTAVAADRIVVAGEEQSGVGQLDRVDGPRRPAGPQQKGAASDVRLVDVAAVRIQRHVAAETRLFPTGTPVVVSQFGARLGRVTIQRHVMSTRPTTTVAFNCSQFYFIFYFSYLSKGIHLDQ